ncbi:uncharacterized protein LOC144161843 isoform X1 [Haemaphysalis longicornis]
MDDQPHVDSHGGETSCGDARENVPRSEPRGPPQIPAVTEELSPARSQELLTHPATENTEPPLAVAFSPVYSTLWPVPAPVYVVAQHRSFQQPNPQVMLRPRAATWTPYSSVPPQAPHRSDSDAAAAGGLGLTSGNAVGTWQPQGFGHVAPPEAGRAGAAAGGPSVEAHGAANAKADGMRQQRDRHNQKERKRRARLTDAFSGLRTVVPGLNRKTDNATVSERAVEYTRVMKRALVEKYGPERAKEICKEFADKFHLDGPIGDFSD